MRHGMLIRDCRSFPGLGGGFMRIAVRGRKDNSRLLNALREILITT
jgi:threonine-phosphate decarboxylase